MPILLLPEDAEYLARSMTRECSEHDISYAARVGIASVVLNRMEDDRYPDTAAAVIASWDAFLPAEDYPIPDYEREYRLCMDACRSAGDGADPTGGALYFEFLEKDVVNDSPYYTVIIDNTAFW
ncbi:MAG: cell wall hydrolase [Clostridia bacterium]|nr:cell wall hydrolase [Clostridia bacterium]